MILIITNKDDVHSDVVINKLHEMGAKLYRLNTESLPERVRLTVLGHGRQKLAIEDDCHGLIDMTLVNSIWFRRPVAPEPHPTMSDEVTRSLTVNESKTTLVWLWDLLEDKFWVNHPRANRLAMNKLRQAALARQMGMRVPEYIITNDPEEAASFIDAHRGEAVVKQISTETIRREDGYRVIYTNRVTPEIRKNLGSVKHAPTFFQEYIPKAFELRVTVVGNDVFACRIDSQESEKTTDDWRRYDFANVPHSVHELPRGVESFCRDLTSTLELVYGAIDMIVTPEGEYAFLEINPNGQWAWIEGLTGMPIGQSIANLLVEGR